MAVIKSLKKRRTMDKAPQQYKNATSRIVCWKCKKGGERGDSPLKKISKTDYVCLKDLQYGAPEQENQSQIFFEKEENLVEKAVRLISGGGSGQTPSTP